MECALHYSFQYLGGSVGVGFNLQYWSRTNYRHFFLVFVRLFLCSPIQPFKRLIILNVTNQLTLDGNINNFYAHVRIREPL